MILNGKLTTPNVRYALDGKAFTIHFFIGNVPEEDTHEAVSQSQTHVGEVYAFVDPVEFDKGQCANCAKQMRDHLVVSGQVPLTNPLLTRHKQHIPHETTKGDITILKSMQPEDVVPFLKENFHWVATNVSSLTFSLLPSCPS